MNRNQFDFEFGKKHGVNYFNLTENLFVFRKPLHIWNEITDETIKFKNVDELLKYEVNGVTVWDLIKDRKHLYDEIVLHGKRGGGSGSTSTFHMGHAGGGGLGSGEAGENHFPAEANTRIKTKTYESALKQFAEFTKDKAHEHSYEVDGDGFVYGFTKGSSISVSPTGRKKGSIVLHNHPTNGDHNKTSHFFLPVGDTDILLPFVKP